MSVTPVIAVFDVGKTNKKLFLFDETYQIVYEKSVCLTETIDEDGFPCESLDELEKWVMDSVKEIKSLPAFQIRAIHFSAYGASLVYLDKEGNALTPLYNYLKPFPVSLSDQFYSDYGPSEKFSLETASPILGSLNSGLQLYRFKKEEPELFRKLYYVLHLPQWLGFLLTGKHFADLTSIGCHTALWNFKQQAYHKWVGNEKLVEKLAPIENASHTFPSVVSGLDCKVGIGLHDSSAALIPYLLNFSMPFVLISTGTWNISLNPFNHETLSIIELSNDCLCYLQNSGKPVKASRLHAGFEHEQQTKRIADYFNQDYAKYKDLIFDQEFKPDLKSTVDSYLSNGLIFSKRNLSDFKSDIDAYHQLVADIVERQSLFTRLIIEGTLIKRIFVDGGFSRNSLFMHLLANAFPEMEVYAASMAQATALGAALAIHSEWNSKPIPANLIELKYYAASRVVSK